jgi:hypothetical protein
MRPRGTLLATRVRTRILVAFALGLVLAAGTALWLFSSKPPPDAAIAASPRAEQPQVPSPGPEPEDASLRHVDQPSNPESRGSATTTVAWPVDVELDLVRPAEGPSAPEVAPLGSGRKSKLTGRIQAAEGVGVPATLHFEAGLNAGRTLQANAQGWFGASDLYPGLALVRVEGPGIPGSLREVRLAQGQEARLSLGYGLPGSLGGTVFGEGDAPLADVEVELDGQKTHTNEGGQFVFTGIAGGTDVVLLLKKEGYAPVHERIGVAAGRTLPADHYRFRMQQGASLEISIPTVVGDSGPALVALTPATLSTEPRFAWWQLGPYEVAPGASLSLRDLPPVRMWVRVYHRGARATPARTMAFLRAGQMERVRIELEPAPRVTGRVLDAQGRGAPGIEVVLEAPDRAAALATELSADHVVPGIGVFDSELLPGLPPGVQRTVTDNDGGFVLSAWEDVAPARYLSAQTKDGALRAEKIVRAGERDVELRLAPRRKVDVRLALEFPGRIQGLPVRVAIQGELRPEVVLAPDESLPLDGLPAGRWRMVARWNGEDLLPGGERELDLPGEELISIGLPIGAIQGQDEETMARAGRRP